MVNYGIEVLRFNQPVAVGAQVKLHATLNSAINLRGITKIEVDVKLEIKDVSKPALAGLWPNNKSMNVVLDLGANIECDEDNFVDFAELGSALYKSLFPNEMPLVSLLNIGSEEIKGTEILKKTYQTILFIFKFI